MPIVTAGLATSRALSLASEHQRLCALLCSPFSAVKMSGPFSLRCLSPLCSPAVGVRHTQPMQVGILHCSLEGFAARRNRIDFFQCACRWADATSAAWDASLHFEYFCDAKCQRGFETTLAFVASRRACCPTAVKLKPSHFSSMPLRASAVTGAGL